MINLSSALDGNNLKRKFENEELQQTKIQKLDNKKNSSLTIHSLPEDLIVQIVHYFPLFDRGQILFVDKRFFKCTILSYRYITELSNKIKYIPRCFKGLTPNQFYTTSLKIHQKYLKMFANLKKLDIVLD